MGSFQQQYGIQRHPRPQLLLRGTRLVSLALVAGLVLVSCGRSTLGDHPPAPQAGSSTGEGTNGVVAPSIDWSAPLRDGIALNNAADLGPYVPFTVVDPRLGTPSLIQVDDPTQVPPDLRLVAFVYDNLSGYGLINIEEQQAPPGMEQNLEQRAADSAATPSPDPSAAQFHILSINGQNVLLGSQLNHASTLWVQGGVLFEVTGPDLTPDQATTLATQLVSTAASAQV